MTGSRDPSHQPPSSARPWEVTLAWLFRVIVATGAIHVWQGKYMYVELRRNLGRATILAGQSPS